MSRRRILTELLPTVARFLRRIRAYQRDFPARVEAVPGRCAQAEAAIATATELGTLWRTTVEPLLRDTSRMLAAGARLDRAGLVRIRPWLIRRVGEADADALLTGLHTSAGPLASLGPVVALDRGSSCRSRRSWTSSAAATGGRCSACRPDARRTGATRRSRATPP